MVSLYHFIALLRISKGQKVISGWLPSWDAVIPAFNEEVNIGGVP